MMKIIYLLFATVFLIFSAEFVFAQSEYNYPDKEFWYDGKAFGGQITPAKIVQGNGSEGFDVEKFINSEMGEAMMKIVKNELAVYGVNNWNHPDMTKHWAERGVIKEIHNADDPEHVWITYLPDYMKKRGKKNYPVVFSAHGGGGTLFEAENHGFVKLCHVKQFIVVAPECENSNAVYTAENLPKILNEMETLGYPIDRSRVYYTGMSAGGMASMYTGLKDNKIVAAIAAHSSPRGIDISSENVYPGLITKDLYDSNTQVPFWIAVGEYDFGQLPFTEGIIGGLNFWLNMNGCTQTTATKDNSIGITADKVYVEEIYGVNYTFAEFKNEEDVLMNLVIGVEGHPHWITPNFAESAWEFMKKFSRSTNGELIVTKN